MDEENFFWSEPLNVDAIVANDGDEYLANADADAQGDENFYGQNQSLAGDSGWWDDNYPGQTVQAANPVDQFGLAELNAAETQQLIARNIDPRLINSFTDPNAGTRGVFVDREGVVFDRDTGLSLPVNSAGRQIIPADVTITQAQQQRIDAFDRLPTNRSAIAVSAGQSNLAGPPDTFIKNAAGDWVENPKFARSTSAANVPITQEERLRINLFKNTPKNFSPNPFEPPEPGPPTEYSQTVAAAARLNRASEIPDPFLTEIDKAGIVIEQDRATIATARNQIDEADQRRALAESIIQQNNAELADPDITDERRRELTENNLAAAQNIFDQTQNIEQNQTDILRAQDNIQVAQANINENAAVYRDTTNPANTTTVDINTNPNLSLVDRVTNFFSGQPKQLAPVSDAGTSGIRRDLEGSGGFINAAGNPVTADGVEILPVTTTTFVDANVAQLPSAATSTALGNNPDAELEAAAVIQVGRQLAQKQAVLNAQKRIPNNSDWRVRLQLAPGATYLYNAPAPGILWPLKQTGGVVFPYTPKIELNYKADYESYALTHSNYKGYFYKSSSLEPVNMTATFTAQDTTEAEYLLAVIHFFRSVTKMFYGRDPERGAPPPLVYLTGLGEFQFTQQPCVVANFNYNLPSDVDYIRARSINVQGTDLLTRRTRQDLPTNPISGAVARLQNLFNSQGINKGANFYQPAPPNLGQNQPTYVPTKLDINLTLLPVQSRSQVSQQFSVKQYANGDLLKRGFW